MPKRIVLSTLFLLVLGAAAFAVRIQIRPAPEPIQVGILHSLTGTMAGSETEVVRATWLAIDEVNAAGGLLGRRVEPIIADGRSDWPTFAEEAERLIDKGVVAVFGCWTSASRKSVKPVFERHDHLLFYPVQYEGLEQSPCIVYTGAAPNQQILPGVLWAHANLGKRFFLTGSDYVYPRTANTIIRDLIESIGAEVVGDEYVPLGSQDVADLVEKIAEAKPEVILNNIVGTTNGPFFRELRARGITSSKTPTLSFGFAEPELAAMDIETVAGDYAAWNYFQSVRSEENDEFVRKFRDRVENEKAVTSDPMEAAYFGVHLWAKTVADCGSTEPSIVREEIRGQSLRAPGGLVSVDSENLHTWKIARVGRVRPDGQFDIVWDSETPVRPLPFPIFRDRTEWEAFLVELQRGWNGAWANPGLNPEGRSR